MELGVQQLELNHGTGGKGEGRRREEERGRGGKGGGGGGLGGACERHTFCDLGGGKGMLAQDCASTRPTQTVGLQQ